MAHPVLNGSEGLEKTAEWLDILRETAVSTNQAFALKLGINPSTAVTTVKPSGTVSQLAEASSGMHYWYSDYYIRTVRADNKDPLTVFLKEIGIPFEADVMAPETSTVFSFPRKAPETAIIGRDVSAIDHLNIWKVYKKHWTEHNPSITVSVRDEEWVEVAAWIYDNWEDVGGLSFLPYNDHVYQQAPYQSISEAEYNEISSRMPEKINWKDLALYELVDSTTGSQELACVASTGCEVVDVSSVVTELAK
jgi:ribonucleoside-diphosphate reductase alpha chain